MFDIPRYEIKSEVTPTASKTLKNEATNACNN